MLNSIYTSEQSYFGSCVKRIIHINSLDFLFGEFSAVDAFYAPVMSRIKTYNLTVSTEMASYQKRVLSHPAVADWCKKALAENIFLDFEEPYRQNINGNDG